MDLLHDSTKPSCDEVYYQLVQGAGFPFCIFVKDYQFSNQNPRNIHTWSYLLFLGEAEIDFWCEFFSILKHPEPASLRCCMCVFLSSKHTEVICGFRRLPTTETDAGWKHLKQPREHVSLDMTKH